MFCHRAFSTHVAKLPRSSLEGRGKIWECRPLSPWTSPMSESLSWLSEEHSEMRGVSDAGANFGERIREATCAAEECSPGAILDDPAGPLCRWNVPRHSLQLGGLSPLGRHPWMQISPPKGYFGCHIGSGCCGAQKGHVLTRSCRGRVALEFSFKSRLRT